MANSRTKRQVGHKIEWPIAEQEDKHGRQSTTQKGTDWVTHTQLIKPGRNQEKFEDTKGVIRSRQSKKDRQYNGQKIPKV